MYRQDRKYMREMKKCDQEKFLAVERYLRDQAIVKKKQEENCGTSPEMIARGKNDRIWGKTPNTDSIRTKGEETSYIHGYYELGSRALAGMLSKNDISESEQRIIGKRDFENGVPEECLKFFKSFPSYLEGYNHQKCFCLGANDYHYINEHGLNFEDYISLMRLIQPLVTTEAYREGYESEKTKFKQKNRARR